MTDTTPQLMQAIARMASEIVPEPKLADYLAAAHEKSQPLRVKYGIDPTFPDVHVGHAVPIRLLREFQKNGHLPVLIIGDGTARLGDPTGRNDQRPPLTKEDVKVNSATYLEQIGPILDLDPSKCEIRHNSEWFGEMDFFDCLRLAANGTSARLLERDDFQKRVQEHLPVHLHEMMYPLMQGWDSVQVKADIEIGGNDQLFNLHMGRQLQERNQQRPQICITTPLLMGTDGRKMSKSYGNYIGLNAEANDAFGKVMSLADDSMTEWFRLLSDFSDEQVTELLAGHPRKAKVALGQEIVRWLFDDKAADSALVAFDKQFQKKEVPDDVPKINLPEGSYQLPNLLKDAGMVQTTSEARRAIQQGGVRLNGEVASDPKLQVALSEQELLVQIGKRRFAKITNS